MKVTIIAEFLPQRKIWIIIPTIILFCKSTVDEDKDCTDLTFAWICFGISLRFKRKKEQMFNKQGDAQPIDLVHTCCLCEMSAVKQINGKYYCGRHSAAGDNIQQRNDEAVDLARQTLSLEEIKALNQKAIDSGHKPLYRVNEVVEEIPEGVLPKYDESGKLIKPEDKNE